MKDRLAKILHEAQPRAVGLRVENYRISVQNSPVILMAEPCVDVNYSESSVFGIFAARAPGSISAIAPALRCAEMPGAQLRSGPGRLLHPPCAGDCILKEATHVSFQAWALGIALFRQISALNRLVVGQHPSPLIFSAFPRKLFRKLA